MSTSAPGLRHLEPENLRRYPRVPVSVPVELRVGKTLVVGRSRNVSLGGLCVSSPVHGIVGDVAIRFSLPGGLFVTAIGTVVCQLPQGDLGIRFEELPPEQFALLAMSLQSLLGHTRSATRIQSRMVITLRARADVTAPEEFAETQFISRTGAMVICRGSFRVNERVYLWWPEKSRGINAHVIYRRQMGHFSEIAVAFDEDRDFWGIPFGPEPAA
jgi:PilZ domain-containing protein